jgi:hypothetical protein
MGPGDWVHYGCFDWGPRLFHAEDARLKEPMLAAGEVCHVDDETGEFWVLRFGQLRVRLRKELVGGAVIPRPVFVWGETVRVKPPRTERVGIVRCIGWHAKQARPLFWIQQGGKKVKHRYFDDELELILAEPSTPRHAELDS